MTATADTRTPCIGCGATVGEALGLMRELGTRWLALVRDGTVIGLVTEQDLPTAGGGTPDLDRGVADIAGFVGTRLVWLDD